MTPPAVAASVRCRPRREAGERNTLGSQFGAGGETCFSFQLARPADGAERPFNRSTEFVRIQDESPMETPQTCAIRRANELLRFA